MHSKRQAVEELAKALLTDELAVRVATDRALGMSWRTIATDVSAELHVEVSHESLRQWYGHEVAA